MTWPRYVLPVLFTLVATALLGQTADLEIRIDAPPAVSGGTAFTWAVRVRNLGPDTATAVTTRTGLESAGSCSDTIAALAPGAAHVLPCTATPDGPPYMQLISARVVSETHDPNDGNDASGKRLDIITPPDLRIDVSGPNALDPALPFEVRVEWSNLAWTTAHDATVTIDVAGATGIASLPENCSASGTRVVCAAGDVPSQFDASQPRAHTLSFVAIAPEQGSVARITATATITAVEPDVDPSSNQDAAQFDFIPTIYVSSTSDSGPGSLRDAIERANGECNVTPCKVAFRIPGGTAPWVTIAPLTPLPTVSARHVRIDGATQTAFFGDTNPEGPEIEIAGSGLAAGDGLRLTTPCSFEVRGLAINGFPGNGVSIGGPGPCPSNEDHGRVVRGCAIGTDPTGRHARPNFRGVFFDDADTVWGAGVDGCIISGNTRSGVYVARGEALITSNIIGLTRDLLAPLPNGASGVYVGPGGDGSHIENNYIGFNRHFGVAIDRDAMYVSVPINSIQANGGAGIDRGLDGSDALLGIAGRLPEPEITSARYDAFNGITIIEGTYARTGPWPYYEIAFYANDAIDASGFGEGQYTLEILSVDDGSFRVSVRGDLRGKWITATATENDPPDFAKPIEAEGDIHGRQTTTSEFGRAVMVE
ncbi:MAG: right-handed parallel beta-helix repeat-containing protein [Thermoanaerobaculia bacterium]